MGVSGLQQLRTDSSRYERRGIPRPWMESEQYTRKILVDRNLSIVLYALFSDFDVVGILGRTLQSLHQILSLTHVINDSNKFPTKVLYLEDFFPHSNVNQQAMVDKFVGVLEKFLGVKATRFSLAERWRQCPPSEAGNRSITEYLAQVSQSPCQIYHPQADRRRAPSGRCVIATAIHMKNFGISIERSIVASHT